MTTRRSFLTLSGGVLAASALAACRETQAAAAPLSSSVPDVVLAGSRTGIVRLTGGEVRPIGAQSVLSRAGDVAYVVSDAGLERVDAATGASLQQQPIGGGWMPRVVAESSDLCALLTTPPGEPPAARATSGLLVVGAGRRQKFNLPGCVEPDAFTSDGTGLFVLDWLPADLPDHYRVRLLDFSDGKLHPLYTRDKTPVPEGAEEQMQGRGRQAVYSKDRQTLYTLYTHQPEHQHTRNLLNGTRSHVHAFVHVLHLAERWAYCLDLPDPFGRGPAEGHALAVDGTRLAVLDTASGSIAHANTETLQIERVARIAAGHGPAGLAYSPDARLFAADGNTVHVFDRTDQALATWLLPSAVRGVRLSADGARLYAGSENEVVWLDAGSGVLRGRVRVDGLTEILSAG
ncbi:hypothetical protein OWR29_32580 [Actinoplanes sp. Pm04-4]|uniref:Uncharacterized protein n=1 Tax=Paractinoplanes pyxinae TaxID=2997416 RepID=A0ABT4B8H8_9ACTN|nr:hypothetical protein [Actinoplanes pyxinae]MCY1142756.1 hypothetical protein [Actinoplanes pyxinae]